MMVQEHTENGPEKGGMDAGRRRFLNRFWLSLGALGLLEGIWLLVSFFMSRSAKGRGLSPKKIVTAGKVSDFAPDSVTAFQQGHFYLVRLEDGGFLALSRKCTHLGCTVPWVEEERRFACPCHGSAYDMTGDVTSSPAPRPLDLFPVTIENSEIRVDIAVPVRRGRFLKEQITY